MLNQTLSTYTSQILNIRLFFFISFSFSANIFLFISSEIDRSALPERFLEYHYAFYSGYKYARHASWSTKNKIKISNRGTVANREVRRLKAEACDLEAALE